MFNTFQGVKMRLERAVCECDATWCSAVCNIKFISRERAEYNTMVKLHKPLNYFGYRIQTFHKASNNEYRPMLLDVSDDYCESYVKHKHSTILAFSMKMLGNHTNIFKPCPWYPGEYYIQNFNFSIGHWPSFIPEGRYILNFTINKQANILGYWQTYFNVVNHGTLDLRVG